MKFLKAILFLLLLVNTVVVAAQAPVDTIKIDDRTFIKVDEEASFPGGAKAWVAYLSKSLDGFSPAEFGSPMGKFTVIAQFVVDTDGSLSQIEMLTNFGYGMENKVTRILEKSGLWSPALVNGKPMKAFRKQPVTFVVQDDGFDLTTKVLYTLFTGMDNRVTVEAKKNRDLRLAISEGTITQEDDENYIVKVNKPGWVIIDVYKNNSEKKLYSFSFEVRGSNDKSPAGVKN